MGGPRFPPRPKIELLLALAAAAGLLLLQLPAPASANGGWWGHSASSSSGGSSSPSSSPPSSERPTADNGWKGGFTSTGDWRSGRATHYGGVEDWWSIHEGSCGYGYLDPDAATGWDIAAMADSCFDSSGSCGKCYEVKCDPTNFNDGYGNHLDRSGVCKDPEASVVVQVTDSCPCSYPGNAYSNKRWCCGDMYHLDVSAWVFEKLAEAKWGVIALKIRPVPCGTTPSKPAPAPQPPAAPNTRISRPWGWYDRRPWFRR